MTVRAFVRVRPKNPDRLFGKAIRMFERDFINTVMGVAKSSLIIVKESTPRATGRTAEAWDIKSRHISLKGFSIVIRNPLPSAVYTHKGAPPSLGAYVPVLGVRIRYGIHHGNIGQWYLDTAKSRIEVMLEKRLRGFVNKFKRNTATILR